METNRRNFIKVASGTALLSGLGITSLSFCNEPAKKAETSEQAVSKLKLNLSCQESVAYGKELNEKLDFIEKLGFVGIEPWGGDLIKRVPDYQKALTGRNIKISVICAGFKGVLISDEKKQRDEAMKSIAEMLPVVGELKANGLIVVPAFNSSKTPPFTEARKILIDELKELGEIAAKNKTKIILEPLNREEAWFLRLVADATAIAKDVNSPGVGVMGDFWHMKWEEPSDYAAFVAAGNYLTHVHMASRGKRRMPGEDGDLDNYVDGFKGLKYINYQNYVSFECGSDGDKQVTIPAAVKLINEQWEKA